MRSSVGEAFWVDLETGYDWFLVILFLIPTTLLNLYATAKAVNILRALISTRFFTDEPKEGGVVPRGEEPMVTIQISCFNEGNVIEDTINAACEVDWPKDKLCVQICDDSTDESVMIIDAVIERWRQRGVMCERLVRPTRRGDGQQKDGCLAVHIDKIQGDFVAMFDADHRCEHQFLRRCIPQFYDMEGNVQPQVGLVQCPWAYTNIHTNLLTEYDALSLDTAFVLEQTGRAEFALGIFSFNGTGGVWRKDAIRAGGGWSWETIAEDFDLSYEERMAQYEFVYLRDLPQPLELPSGIRAHVQQKFRWTTGFFQVARKTLWRIIRNPSTPMWLKSEVFFQFTGAAAFSLALLVVLLVPILSNRNLFSLFLATYTVAPSLVPLFGGLCTIFGKVSGSDGQYRSVSSRLCRCFFIPTLYTFALGMMVFETFAMFEGLTSDDVNIGRGCKEGASKRVDHDEEESRSDMSSTTTDDIEMNASSRSTRTRASTSSQKSSATRHNKGSNCETQACCFPKLNKKAQKFKRNLTKGLSGLVAACYLSIWCAYLYVDKARDREPNHYPSAIMVFFLPLPAIGLFCVHGMFVWALLRSKCKRRMRKRAYAKLRDTGEGKQRKKTPEVFHLSDGRDGPGFTSSERALSPHTFNESHQNGHLSPTPSRCSKSSGKWSKSTRSSKSSRAGLQGHTSFRGLLGKSSASATSSECSFVNGISARRPQYVLVPDRNGMQDGGILPYGDLADGEIVIL
uniref:Glycosyltransferase 2-like domain-containing protein n=1 Tax=Grammatophora oceanica TaxID=210454 RepID=A0A7S1VCH2_9STRA|mmetsp:Transcript_41479/g.61387  ORF Transcript_41479/g.61387 Transcript_41479/m.61387 type:complete len:740 (+) Transcript_41479:600-2819(+)|eukprot:CAMPEP_0194057672 /NCGR_PEP_ID=MMETSP0009_2-20130614/63942_1 /TAXON_ID=210454 /ORGANISM="Grammatophora oceanica, Strain CCMP 410" /LENGTH=739 /DNA_ID=CAMNT_0038707515 /DNA_START=582 /DNA_END=2801 /DNA_ORIENTATION=-